MHSSQHVCAVGALLAASLDQTTMFEPLEHLVEQKVLCPARHQAGAEIAQNTEVEPRIGQFEPKGVLPVDAGPHGIGRLPVTELLEKLQYSHQGQSPWREAGLTPTGIQCAEVRVLEKSGELLSKPHHQGAPGKCGLGNACRLGRDLAYGHRVQAHWKDLWEPP